MGSDADPPVRSETASRSTSRYVPILHTDHSGARPSVPEPSPTVMSGWFASAPSYPSMSNSPSLGPLSLDSPRTANPYSPTTASPATVTSKRESSFEPQYQHSAFGRESEGQPDRTAGYGTPRPAFGHMIPPAPASPISTQPLSVYPPSGDLRPRRPYRESLQLPPLTHEDTTYSSHESSHSGSFSAPPPRPQYLPSISDVTKSTPILPQLGPTIARTAPMPDRSMLLGASAAHGDHRRNSSLAALAEASEIARGADAEQPEPSRPP
ncbi:hypothetical protein M011DRAFT_465917 [Sporormia fimetaria CBS 119925]|uniref:Uncharacterized protein n=1 Tax=Sporormia fimetaria CBS 119925 TaxID=1340428 RepID=A0A6A6VFU8_9PLEO|nr:hypothetical protein M011DRAFT_465917 [Sporormia fimetaria CBS 119925]